MSFRIRFRGGRDCASAMKKAKTRARIDTILITSSVGATNGVVAYFSASILRHTGDGMPGVSETNVSFPVLGFTRKVTMLFESWLATHRNSPFKSIRKLRGIF